MNNTDYNHVDHLAMDVFLAAVREQKGLNR